MTHTDTSSSSPPKKGILIPVVIGVLLMGAMGGAGFFATYKELILGPAREVKDISHVTEGPAVKYIPLDPIVVSIGGSAQKHLRFTSQLEVSPEFSAEVELHKPRIVDAINTYLRAITAQDIEDPIAILKIKSQIYRRAELVVGPGRINNILVMEFLVN